MRGSEPGETERIASGFNRRNPRENWICKERPLGMATEMWFTQAISPARRCPPETACTSSKRAPTPPLNAWLGTWGNGKDRIRIQPSKSAGKLDLQGEASWHGHGDVVHTGDFAGEAMPAGNRLHFVEEGANSCTVDLTLIGKYIVANDN